MEESKREPWMAVLVTLIFDPFLGMCYINKGRLALVFLGIELALVLIILILIFNPYIFIAMVLVVRFIGAGCCYRIAKKQGIMVPLRWYAHWLTLVLFLVIPISFRVFLYEPFHTASASMSPTINAGDYFFAEKFAYNNQAPRRGDVIVFRVPQAHNEYFFKRVIGLPGDKVQLKDGTLLYINGAQTVQKKIDDFDLYDSHGESKVCQFVEVSPEGKEYRILIKSTASPYENTPIYSVPEHQYFVLGDNRDQSVDSRFQDKVGFVPEENIRGKALEVLWNYRTHIIDPTPVQ